MVAREGERRVGESVSVNVSVRMRNTFVGALLELLVVGSLLHQVLNFVDEVVLSEGVSARVSLCAEGGGERERRRARGRNGTRVCGVPGRRVRYHAASGSRESVRASELLHQERGKKKTDTSRGEFERARAPHEACAVWGRVSGGVAGARRA